MTQENQSDIIILTGAGFSKAYGLPLAYEFNNYLCNDIRIRDNQFLFNLLRSDMNFENIYSILLERNDKDFEDFFKALLDRFDIMNQYCIHANTLEPITPNFKVIINKFFEISRKSVLHFFTTNQDILLEHLVPIRQSTIGGIDLIYPGICYISLDDSSAYRYDLEIRSGDIIHRNDISKIDIKHENDFRDILNGQKKRKAISNDSDSVKSIYYYKLHGSSNWFDKNGKLMIVGTDKMAQIERSNLIAMYFKVFEEEIKGKSLLVIGYSFNDGHINDIIRNAVKYTGTKVYYISPEAHFGNEKLSSIVDIVDKMFPYKLEKMLNYTPGETNSMSFEMKEVLSALSLQGNEP